MHQHPKRGGEPAPIGHLIRRIEREIENARPTVWPTFSNPGELKSRLLRALGAIQRYGPEDLHITRAQLRHLAALVGCAAREDLAKTGGFLGGSNDYYANRLGVLPATVTTIFRALKTAGFIEPHNPTANNRRSCHLKPDGHRDGRGYTLRPTVERLAALEALAARLEQDALSCAAKRFEAKTLIAEAAAIAAELDHPALAHVIPSLQNDLAAARRAQSPLLLDAMLERAIGVRNALRQDLRDRLKTAAQTSKNRDQSRKKSRQHHTGEQLSSVFVLAQRESSSGYQSDFVQSSDHAERAEPGCAPSGTDTCDELTCGLTIAEARILFPEASDYIPRTPAADDMIIAATGLGQRLRVNPRLLGRSFEAMGITRTLWSLHIVHHRFEAGQIERDPASYFNGMVSRAMKGELDIDRSIWGIRGDATGTPRPFRRH